MVWSDVRPWKTIFILGSLDLSGIYNEWVEYAPGVYYTSYFAISGHLSKMAMSLYIRLTG